MIVEGIEKLFLKVLATGVIVLSIVFLPTLASAQNSDDDNNCIPIYGGGCPSPTPTRTPTPTTTVTPTPMITVTPTVTPLPQGGPVNCQPGFVAVVSGSGVICMQQIQIQNQTQDVSANANASTGPINVNSTNTNNTVANQVVPVAPTQGGEVAGVKELPKTGLPLLAWALSGLLPIGAGLKRLGGKNQDKEETLYYLTQKREFQKE